MTDLVRNCSEELVEEDDISCEADRTVNDARSASQICLNAHAVRTDGLTGQ